MKCCNGCILGVFGFVHTSICKSKPTKNAFFSQLTDSLLFDLNIKSGACCGGSGTNIWKNSQWECAECGTAKSNDPNYLYGGAGEVEYGSLRGTIQWGSPVCECGSEKTYGPNGSHTSWCPKYVKP